MAGFSQRSIEFGVFVILSQFLVRVGQVHNGLDAGAFHKRIGIRGSWIVNRRMRTAIQCVGRDISHSHRSEIGENDVGDVVASNIRANKVPNLQFAQVGAFFDQRNVDAHPMRDGVDLGKVAVADRHEEFSTGDPQQRLPSVDISVIPDEWDNEPVIPEGQLDDISELQPRFGGRVL